MVGNTSEMKICEEFPASWDGEDHPESDRQHHPLAPRIGPEQPEYGGQEKGGDGGGLAAEALQRIHHKGAGAWEGEGYPKDRVQRFGDRDPALDENVRQPGAEPERNAEDGKPATLSKQEYIDIIAYLLMMNGHPAGAQALPLDPSVLGHNNKA